MPAGVPNPLTDFWLLIYGGFLAMALAFLVLNLRQNDILFVALNAILSLVLVGAILTRLSNLTSEASETDD